MLLATPETKPICIDLYCGLGGWAAAFLAEGYRVIGYDIEAHDYGTGGYPGELVLQDVTTLHGSAFKDAAVIVASPPCQAYSYRAMPWSRAKALPPPDNTLFETCFRIQREACEAAGRYIPMIVENVRGAQKWVGRARWHYGSFYLWGDVPALMPMTIARQKFNPDGTAHSPGSWFAIADSKERGKATKNSGGSWFAIGSPGQKVIGQNPDGRKTRGHANIRDGHAHTRHLTNQYEHDAVKQPGFQFEGSGRSFQTAAVAEGMKGYVPEGTKALGKHGHPRILPQIVNKTGSGTKARKAASAMIAKIPYPLAEHIARTFKPKAGVPA